MNPEALNAPGTAENSPPAGTSITSGEGPRGQTRGRNLFLTVLLLLGFICICSYLSWNSGFSDLAPEYLAARFLATGRADHLYVLDPGQFNVTDPVWLSEWHRLGYAYSPAPFVQTPLLAWALEPVCTRHSYLWLAHVVTVLSLVASAAILWMIASRWAPRFLAPGPMLLACILLASWDPFRYSLKLGQTHIVVACMALAALLLVDANYAPIRPAWRNALPAGLLLSIATVIKITPGFLLLYWLARRQWRAASCFVACLLMLWGATLLLVGHPVTREFVQTVRTISNTVFVSYNNQSLAAWWMGPHYPQEELLRWRMLPLPVWLKQLSTGLMAAACLIGGFMDFRSKPSCNPTSYGAALAIAASTVFAPLSWSHYGALLVIPCLIMADSAFSPKISTRLRLWLAAVIVVVEVLNVRVWAALGPHPFHIGGFTPRIVRTQFYCWILAIVMMGVLYLHSRPGASKLDS
ncbi:Protein of unknown function [Bryocella elongata]|uniref:Alpha-1,2-mannosyltransferase n=1 Tax=Bryocella elongata TaxID=863522 RepID=A0A1H6ABJ1_9BACT|nr:glycosyltransferase family 87 protein [Bryocella elongata]SEG45821.1 Protein of unknown function [Bryocella elongata]